ncbi:MAG: DUF4349 domain-containing protein [Patescibacteria group bacterium]|nr:DUF4349 domain-containing protein [Patescibacteria group bacterium]
MKSKTKKILVALALLILLFIGYKLFSSSPTAQNSSREEPIAKGISPSPEAVPESESSMAFSSQERFSASRKQSQPAADSSVPASAQDKKIIKNGNLYLKVSKIDQAAREITVIAQTNGGEISSSSFSENTRGQKSGTLVVRIPSNKFETVIEAVKKTASQITDESTTSRDVTEEYIDLEAQLKNKQAEEQSFVRILGQAGAIKDILEVTREIARARGEIERLQGKIKYLESQVSMSTISISLSQDSQITPQKNNWRPYQVFKNSLSTLIKKIQNFIDRLIFVVIVVIPVLIPYTLSFLIACWIIKKIYRKIKGKDSSVDKSKK